MKLYLITVWWDRNGNKYPMRDELRIEASSVRAAVTKALAPMYRKHRKGWREPDKARFTITATILGTTDFVDDLKPQTKEEKTDGV